MEAYWTAFWIRQRQCQARDKKKAVFLKGVYTHILDVQHYGSAQKERCVCVWTTFFCVQHFLQNEIKGTRKVYVEKNFIPKRNCLLQWTALKSSDTYSLSSFSPLHTQPCWSTGNFRPTSRKRQQPTRDSSPVCGNLNDAVNPFFTSLVVVLTLWLNSTWCTASANRNATKYNF